jgi:hypothetical protein
METLTLNLSFVTNALNPSIFQVQIPKGQLDWTSVIPGTPGQYTLKESGHPGWNCSVSQT